MKSVYVFGTRGFPDVQGGVEKHCEYLYKELEDRFDIVVFRRKGYLRTTDKTLGRIRFIDLPSSKIKGLEAYFHSFLATLYCLIKRPDMIHIHNIGPGMFIPLLRLCGLDVLLTYHSPNYEHQKWGVLARFVLRMSEKLAVNWANAIVFVNKDQLSRFGRRVQEKSVYIPNGVHLTEPTGSTTYLNQLGLSAGNYLLAVGRITQEKGFDYLIEAFSAAKLAGYTLVVAGGIDHATSYSKKIIQEARQHQVVLTGYVDGLCLQELYSHASLFVLPSYHEGFPLVLLEAMGYGLPIVCSDISANRLLELPSDNYFKAGSVDELSHKMAEQIRLGKTTVRYDLTAYTWEYVGKQVEWVFNNLHSPHAKR